MTIFSFLYKHIFKPLAFSQDPETVHDHVLSFGKFLGKFSLTRSLVKWLFLYESPSLSQTLLGINFSNPIGLSAGFDKNAELLSILPSVGFGFAEVGSITGEPCAGNSGKRLWRLPKSKSLLVYYGLKNDGAEAISKKLTNQKFNIPVGINVAKTNSADTVETTSGVADYVKAYTAFAKIGSYTTINISCPNAFGGQPFTDPESLDALLFAISKIETSKPIFIKLSPDLSNGEIDELIKVIDKYPVAGLICTNLTKNRQNSKIIEKNNPEFGGFSGKVVEELSNELIKYVYKKTKGKYLIIGCGGVFSAQDAYKKIRLGASLVQLITGMIYQGPTLIGEINKDLVKLLKKDGFSNISQAVGVDNLI